MFKILSNIITLGATGKVEESVNDFNYAKSKYEKRYDEFKDCFDAYNSDKKIFEDELKSLKSHKSKLIKMGRNSDLVNSLGKEELDILSSITQNTPVESMYKKIEFTSFNGSISPDDDFNNFSSMAATLIMGPFGPIGAHSSANEQVEENRKKRREIVDLTSQLTDDIISIKNEHGLIIKHREAVKIIKEIIQQGA